MGYVRADYTTIRGYGRAAQRRIRGGQDANGSLVVRRKSRPKFGNNARQVEFHIQEPPVQEEITPHHYVSCHRAHEIH